MNLLSKLGHTQPTPTFKLNIQLEAKDALLAVKNGRRLTEYQQVPKTYRYRGALEVGLTKFFVHYPQNSLDINRLLSVIEQVNAEMAAEANFRRTERKVFAAAQALQQAQKAVLADDEWTEEKDRSLAQTLIAASQLLTQKTRRLENARHALAQIKPPLGAIAEVPWEDFEKLGLLRGSFHYRWYKYAFVFSSKRLANIQDFFVELTNQKISLPGMMARMSANSMEKTDLRDLAKLCYRCGILLPGMPDVQDDNTRIEEITFLFNKRSHAYELTGLMHPTDSGMFPATLGDLRKACVVMKDGKAVAIKIPEDFGSGKAPYFSHYIEPQKEGIIARVKQTLELIFDVPSEASAKVVLGKGEKPVILPYGAAGRKRTALKAAPQKG